MRLKEAKPLTQKQAEIGEAVIWTFLLCPTLLPGHSISWEGSSLTPMRYQESLSQKGGTFYLWVLCHICVNSGICNLSQGPLMFPQVESTMAKKKSKLIFALVLCDQSLQTN